MNKIAIISVILFFTSGCVNQYQANYTQANGATPEVVNFIRAHKPLQQPMVERAPNVDANTLLAMYIKRSYIMIGTSFFNSSRSTTDSEAIETGKMVGADLVVIFNPSYTGSTTTQVPITTPTTTTSLTNGSATAYGAGGVVNAFGTSTTTTYGTQTTYIPITVDHSSYGAVYFIKSRHPLGAVVRDLNDDEKKKYQTNKGVIVGLVIDDSPAFASDILVDDLIKEINGVKITNENIYNEVVFSSAKKLSEVILVRNGLVIKKQIQFAQ